jgi:hypothetical protein
MWRGLYYHEGHGEHEGNQKITRLVKSSNSIFVLFEFFVVPIFSRRVHHVISGETPDPRL